jgi:hypothetical protein
MGENPNFRPVRPENPAGAARTGSRTITTSEPRHDTLAFSTDSCSRRRPKHKSIENASVSSQGQELLKSPGPFRGLRKPEPDTSRTFRLASAQVRHKMGFRPTCTASCPWPCSSAVAHVTNGRIDMKFKSITWRMCPGRARCRKSSVIRDRPGPGKATGIQPQG